MGRPRNSEQTHVVCCSNLNSFAIIGRRRRASSFFTRWWRLCRDTCAFFLTMCRDVRHDQWTPVSWAPQIIKIKCTYEELNRFSLRSHEMRPILIFIIEDGVGERNGGNSLLANAVEQQKTGLH